MSQSIKEIQLEEIGPIRWRQNTRVRNLRIRVDPKNGVTVVVPAGIPEKYVLDFVKGKKDWIRRAILRQEDVKRQNTLFTDNSNFQTRTHILSLCKHAKSTMKSHVSHDIIRIWYPDFAEVKDQRVQDFIRKTILETWRIEAKIFLPKRVKELAQKFNFTYEKLSIKNARTRWGSCSSKNNINLNLQLMRLPDDLIDYVILHELNHTLHKNHQKSFWLALEQILPGARKLDKSLNKYHLEYW